MHVACSTGAGDQLGTWYQNQDFKHAHCAALQNQTQVT